MKKILTIALFVLVSACGAEQNNSETKTSLHPDTFKSEVLTETLQGNIIQVAARASDMGMGMWTEISLDYMVPCTHTLDKINYTTEMIDGTLKIYASALATYTKNEGQFVCQAFSNKTKVITVPGIIGWESVELVNMVAPSKVLPKGFAVTPIESIELVSTSPLCPDETICKTDGTILTLDVGIGCLDKVGPVSYKVSQTKDDQGKQVNNVIIAAYNFANPQSMVALCTSPYKSLNISLPTVYGSKDSFKIQIIK